MKRFKDLDAAQKKNAIDYMFKQFSSREIFASPLEKKPDYIGKRLKEIQEEIKFCGCIDCFNKFADKAGKDSQVREWMLNKAINIAEQGYYPEEEDVIIKVS